MELLLTLAIAAALGLIPAYIAKNKGHSFGIWWLYGWMLFIVAIIHVQFIEDYNAPKSTAQVISANASVADEIKKYKDLLDQGIITEEEFQKKKNMLLNS